MNNGKDNLAARTEERAPDSGRPVLTTPAPFEQVKDDQQESSTSSIQAKMAAGVPLTEEEKLQMDQYAEAIRSVENDLEQVKSGKLTLMEMMARMANMSGSAFSSVAPAASTEQANEPINIPRNSDVSGIVQMAADEEVPVGDKTLVTTTLPSEAIPVSAEVQRNVTLIVDEAPASAEDKQQMERQDTILAQPAFVPAPEVDVAPAAAIDTTEVSAQPVQQAPLPSPQPSSRRNSSGRPSKHPNAQLTMSTDGNYFEVDGGREAVVSTGDAELDADFAEFQHMTLRAENVAVLDSKRRIKDVLDNLEIEEIHNREQLEFANRKRNSSKLANLGSMIKGVFHTVESVFSPKASIFRNAKNQKENDLVDARNNLERDIQCIRTGNDAIGQYVDQSFGITFTFDTANPAELNRFISACKGQPESGHYAAVNRIVKAQVEARINQYNAEIEKIQNDQSYQQNINEMLYGSPATAEAEETKGSLYLRMKEKISGWFGGKKERLERPSWIDQRIAIPMIGSAVSFSALTQKAKLIDPKNLASQDEQTDLVNIDALKARQAERKNEERKRKGGWFLAAAAALGLAGLAGYGVYKSVKDNASHKGESASVAEGPKTSPTAAPTASASAASQAKVASLDLPKEKSPEEVIPKEVEPKKPEVKAPAVKSSPRLAKKLPNSIKVPSVDKYDPDHTGKKAEVIDMNDLSLAEKDAAVAAAEAKRSAYSRKVDLMIGSDFPLKATEKEVLNALIQQITEQSKSLRKKADLTKLDGVYAEIERNFDKLEKERTVLYAPKYIADAEVNSKVAMAKLKVIKGLMAGKGNRFTIHHIVNQSKTATTTSTLAKPYDVDLDSIELKLKQIIDRNSVGNSIKTTEIQAKMDAADAKYWVDYLKFVDWYARYALNGSSVTFGHSNS